MVDLFESLSAAVAELSPRRKYLIGVSGGRDSMCLLYALRHLGFAKLVVCHLDHGLRPRAARADRNAVARLTEHLGLTLEEDCVDVGSVAKNEGKSVELAARECRHRFFEACARRQRTRETFLAHHADDQVETILFNFLRGAGPAGLAGMAARTVVRRLEIHRPLLNVTRQEIEDFARKHRVPFREDASNRDPKHTRNRFRHEVLPLLRETMGHAVEPAILRAAKIQGEIESWVEKSLPVVDRELKCAALRELPLALRRRAVLSWLRQEGVVEPGFAETEGVLGLLEIETGPAKINLPGGIHARRRSGAIFLERP